MIERVNNANGWLTRTMCGLDDTCAGLAVELNCEDPARAAAEFARWHAEWRAEWERRCALYGDEEIPL